MKTYHIVYPPIRHRAVVYGLDEKIAVIIREAILSSEVKAWHRDVQTGHHILYRAARRKVPIGPLEGTVSKSSPARPSPRLRMTPHYVVSRVRK